MEGTLKNVSIGLIGVGGIGKIHFNNCLRLHNARLVAVADTSRKARTLAKNNGIKKVYDSYENLLRDPSVDCVIIALPTFLHAKCAIQAAENGKHIFVEKPLARNVNEGKEIISKVEKSDVKIMVGYPLPFSEFSIVKKEIESGHLGDVVIAHAVNVSNGPFFPRTSSAHRPAAVPSWWFDLELTGGGALLDLGSHMINLLRWYFGGEILSVKSALGYRFNMPFEDSAVCFLKFKQGISAIVNVGWFAQKKSIMVELFGTTSTISMGLIGEKRLPRILHLLGIKKLREASAFYNELNHFVNCIIDDRSPSSSAASALRDLEIISLAYANQIQ